MARLYEMPMRLSAIGLIVGLVLVPAVSEAQYRGRFNSEYQSAIQSLGTEHVASISIPVAFGVEVSDLTRNFGDPRGTGRTHEGLDILAKKSTPIVSPTDAVVTSTGTGANSGIYVRTANPGGETFVYMHLSLVANGVQGGTVLKRGDVIGYVGNTGNASGGPDHLHFEIRKNGATDPYSRLTSVFSLDERMRISAQALEKNTDASLASTLVRNFKDTFMRARDQGISIPSAISAVMGTSSSAPVGTNSTSTAFVLVPGDAGQYVVQLQRFLIEKNAGVAATRLKSSGATGYFGAITTAALMEYQTFAAVPATGLVDAETYQLIFVLGQQSGTTDPEAIHEESGVRDLELGSVGEDVRALQVFLNAAGYVIASTGPGSTGSESTYFGALTKAALSRYQSAHGITPAVGYFGPKTRAKIGL